IVVVPIISILITVSKVKKGDFVVVTDTLVASKTRTSTAVRIATALLFRFVWANPYEFQFANHGKYFLADKEVYTFSEKYKMSDDSFYNSSHISDKYYLVICGKRIILAYNQNQFEMNEEPHRD
ncbi:MAG: hypothetical protein KBS52_01425, partial [Clostridiales bacterium]|nr:hypothetical protein [Candidatus Equinaster intestinalis]